MIDSVVSMMERSQQKSHISLEKYEEGKHSIVLPLLSDLVCPTLSFPKEEVLLIRHAPAVRPTTTYPFGHVTRLSLHNNFAAEEGIVGGLSIDKVEDATVLKRKNG